MTYREMLARIRRAWRRLEEFHDAVFESRWRREIRRDARAQHDTLRALLFLDTLGVDNPVAYETVEIVPYLVADLHAWHQRMGQREYGDPGMCC